MPKLVIFYKIFIFVLMMMSFESAFGIEIKEFLHKNPIVKAKMIKRDLVKGYAEYLFKIEHIYCGKGYLLEKEFIFKHESIYDNESSKPFFNNGDMAIWAIIEHNGNIIPSDHSSKIFPIIHWPIWESSPRSNQAMILMQIIEDLNNANSVTTSMIKDLIYHDIPEVSYWSIKVLSHVEPMFFVKSKDHLLEDERIQIYGRIALDEVFSSLDTEYPSSASRYAFLEDLLQSKMIKFDSNNVSAYFYQSYQSGRISPEIYFRLSKLFIKNNLVPIESRAFTIGMLPHLIRSGHEINSSFDFLFDLIKNSNNETLQVTSARVIGQCIGLIDSQRIETLKNTLPEINNDKVRDTLNHAIKQQDIK